MEVDGGGGELSVVKNRGRLWAGGQGRTRVLGVCLHYFLGFIFREQRAGHAFVKRC